MRTSEISHNFFKNTIFYYSFVSADIVIEVLYQMTVRVLAVEIHLLTDVNIPIA